MSDSDNYLKILEKISEVREGVGILSNEIGHVKLDVSDTRRDIEKLHEQDIHQNSLLDKHILGVQTAMARLDNEIAAREDERELIQKQISEIDKRLKKTEFLPDFFISLRKIVKWLAAFALALGAIAKLSRWF